MSRENVEIAHRVLEAWNRRDAEAILELADPEIEYVNPPEAVEPGTRQGHEGLVAVLRSQWDFLVDGAQVEIERTYDRGDDVYTLARIVGRMPDSDAVIDAQGLFLWRVRAGKLVRVEGIATGAANVAAALEGAGLPGDLG
jgi:ketosteroid isomerase-like protein